MSIETMYNEAIVIGAIISRPPWTDRVVIPKSYLGKKGLDYRHAPSFVSVNGEDWVLGEENESQAEYIKRP